MQKVITDEKLYEYEEQAIALLCGTVKKTLGPKGSNAIINHSLLNPFITNDGVTIAKNIESEDEAINTILTIAKEASIKTDELVGDGTTTTLVLLESIFQNGLNAIKEGLNPQILKKELIKSSQEIISKIKNKSREPNQNDFYHIASIAASDEKIGQTLTDMFLKLQKNPTIKVVLNNNAETIAKIVTGYSFETIIASPYFFANNKVINYENNAILLTNQEIECMEQISPILNHIIDNKNNLIIMAVDYASEVINEILALNFNGITNVTLLKLPEYGVRQLAILKDLELITKAKLVKLNESISVNDLGKCEYVAITKDTILINNNLESSSLKTHIQNLKIELKEMTEEYDRDFLQERIAKLTSGIGLIYVGATTNTEAKEIKMRYDDALAAIKTATYGILPGSGLILSQIAEELNTQNIGNVILKEALKKPLFQILENAGYQSLDIYEKIKEQNFNVLFNIYNEKFENIKTTKVIDPTYVVINALQNAISIASLLLTTTTLIINEQKEVIKAESNIEI